MTAHVVVIGAGSTGAAIAHDLALRGLRVTLVERGEIASGTTGRNHCLLHSGGRYAVTDPQGALECAQENRILRAIMPDALELNGGLFVAVSEEDVAYKAAFLEGCAAAGIPAEEWTVERALLSEPLLSPRILAAVHVPDGVFEPYRLCLAFLATAQRNGARVLAFHEVLDLLTEGGRCTGVQVADLRTGRARAIGADLVINAAGPWAGRVAALAGVDVPVRPAAGVMVTLARRLSQQVINRLQRPGDGDIVVPVRQTSIVGTTSWPVEDADAIAIREDHVRALLETGARLVPAVAEAPVRGVMAAARPLVGSPRRLSGLSSDASSPDDAHPGDERDLTRSFACFDHAADGVAYLLTVAGGKTTTARAMAEAAGDAACAVLGVEAACRTRAERLLSFRAYRPEAGPG